MATPTYTYLTDANGQIWQISVATDGTFVQTPVASIPGQIQPVVSAAPTNTRAGIISLVQSMTERALVGQVDFEALFLQVLQEFCGEHRYWWRKKTITFPTVANTDAYDLPSLGTETPAGAGALVEEITKISRVDSATAVDDLDAITDDAAIHYNLNNSGVSDKPTAWMPDPRDPSGCQRILLRPVPNGAYTLYVSFWAMPNMAFDSSDGNIYVVPPFLHHVLVTGLEREVWRLKYGEQDPKFITADTLYKKKVEAAKVPRSLAGEKQVSFRRNDGRAIRSTR